MATSSKRHRGRSRKRRPEPGRRAGAAASSDHAGADAEAGSRRARRSPARASSSTAALGNRPQAPWHPLPLSELLILVGAIAAVYIVVVKQDIEGDHVALIAAVAAVLIGTIETTAREHRSGFRSHAIILAVMVVIVFHSVVLLVLSSVTAVPRLVNLGLLAIDVALFVVLFRILRAGFREARRRRAFGGR